MALMNVFLHVNRRCGALLQGCRYSDLLADRVQIKLGDISSTAFDVILVVGALVGWLRGHTHLGIGVADDTIDAHGAAALLHLDLLALHLAGRALDSGRAVAHLGVEVRHHRTPLRPSVNYRVLPLSATTTATPYAIGAPVNLVNGLLDARDINHRLLGLLV